MSEHKNAVADDEIRFHILHIIARYHEIRSQRNQEPDAKYLFFEPLVFTCWESIGRTISARWCERNPEVRSQGKQILTAFLLENHWFPFWIVPHEDCLTFHTIAHETADAQQFRDVCACIGQQLGFPLFALHISPSRLPSHDMCGTAAMMFLAHIVHGATMPDDLDALVTLHTNMRATFVADLYTKSEVPAPVIWGNGFCSGESGLLPRMPCLGMPVKPEPQLDMRNPPADCVGSHPIMPPEEFGWTQVVHLIRLMLPVDVTVPTLHVFDGIDSHSCEHLNTLAMDATEMKFHLSVLNAGLRDIDVDCDIPQLTILNELNEVLSALSAFVHGKHHVGIHVGLVNCHWVPVVFVRHVHVVRAFVPAALVRVIQPHFEASRVIVQAVAHDDSHNLCGAFAFNVVASMIGVETLIGSIEDLECQHMQLKGDFLCSGSFENLSGCIGFGPQGTLLKELTAELLQHGVPSHLAETRAKDAISVIGSDQLLTAMKHKQPWRQLKTLGNQKKFKFVLPSELAQVVESKPSGGGKGKGKTAGKHHTPVELDPNKLQIVDGVFRAQNKIIPQIHVKQIGPVSSGVILMTLAEAEPYLRTARCVSTEPLALAILHNPDAQISTALPHANVTVPCRCTVDKEPVLADATLVQIGQGLVEKHVHSDLVELDTLEVVTLKFLVYRDEIPCSWEEFCKAPIKFLVNAFPLLRRCQEKGCQCDRWHNPEQLDVREPILDVWRRQFLHVGFKPAPAEKADIFSVCVRVPAQLLVGLLAASGNSGAYGEPRTADGVEILPEYTVVWSPKLNVQELMHLKQTNPAIIGIARVGERRGLRVQSSQAAKIHQLVRPDTVYLPQGQRSMFLVGPFPFGVDRSAICRAMKQAGWECRPLQPSAPLPGKGSMWIVQAVDEPVNTIIPTSHGEVVITRHRPDPVSRQPTHAPVASAATLALCGAQSSKPLVDNDPWSVKDPWGGFKPSSVAHADNTESMQQLEQRVQNAVLAKIPAPSMEDDMPERMSMLEGQVQQLMVKQQGLEGQFQDFSAQQGQQLSAMQVQINNHGQQLHGHMENQNQAIQSMFAQQMEQIRGLLSKRPRDEFE